MNLVFSTLGEEATIIMGQSPPGDSYNRDGKGAPLLNGPSEFGPDHPREVQWTTSPTKFCKTGDVLFCVRGATAGRLNTADKEYCIGRGLAAIRGRTGKFDSGFLRYVLANGYARFQARGVGSTFINISAEELMRFPVPTLPLPEQRRIAAILHQAETSRAKRRQALAKLDTLTQSLFLEMFGDPIENYRGWPVVHVRDFVTGFETGKSISAPDEGPSSTYRILKISAVTALEYDSNEVKPLPPDFAPTGKDIVKDGDLLFSRANTSELIGATAYVFSTPPNLVLPDKLWRFVWNADTPVEPVFIWYLFRQPGLRREISRRATGTSGSMKNISQGKVLSIKTALPPLRLQQAFAERLLCLAKSRAEMRRALFQFDGLFTAVQQRAFRGEL